MRLLRRLRAYLRIARKATRNQNDLMKHLVRRPAILAAVGGYETAVMFSNKVEPRLKYLASVRASSRVGCPF
ncbi:MAG: hypothetical protein QOK43_3114 [Acidimicrobiaceae bacterium]|jgi:alkylhydroperoxidase family enzyme|nr:hypothetical protein [Acidimicrobiaceae bacterium]MDQ1445265.1 hypothetical protein [Acidimicrobiaceae bacterium]